jgi:hypothetical protein
MMDHHNLSPQDSHHATNFNFDTCASCFLHKVKELAARGCFREGCKYAKMNEFIKGKGTLDDEAVKHCNKTGECHGNLKHATSEARLNASLYNKPRRMVDFF